MGFKEAPEYFGYYTESRRYWMVKYDNNVDYYLDPTNPYLKKDGTPSDINNPNYEGNFMMEI